MLVGSTNMLVPHDGAYHFLNQQLIWDMTAPVHLFPCPGPAAYFPVILATNSARQPLALRQACPRAGGGYFAPVVESQKGNPDPGGPLRKLPTPEQNFAIVLCLLTLACFAFRPAGCTMSSV